MALAEAADLQLGVLDDLVGYTVQQGQLRMYADSFRNVGDPIFTPTRFATLLLIGKNSGLTQSALGQAMGIARSQVKLRIDWPQARGLVEWRPQAVDRDRNRHWLTVARRRRPPAAGDAVAPTRAGDAAQPRAAQGGGAEGYAGADPLMARAAAHHA